MSKFRKYYLVEAEKYKHLVENKNSNDRTNDILAHPNIKAVKKIDSDISGILKDPKLNDTEKMDAYASQLDSYIRNFRNALEVPRGQALLGAKKVSMFNTPKEPTQQPNLENQNEDAKLFNESDISPSYLPRAHHLATFMKQNKKFSVGEDGNLKYKGVDIFNSQPNDLLKGVVRHKKPLGDNKALDQFISSLKEEGYPVSRLGYVRRNLPAKVPISTRKYQLAKKLQNAKRVIASKESKSLSPKVGNQVNERRRRKKHSPTDKQEKANSILAAWK